MFQYYQHQQSDALLVHHSLLAKNYVSDHHFNETVLMIHLQTWQGIGSVRLEMVFKARQEVPSWYSLTDLEGSEEMRTVCKRCQGKLADSDLRWMNGNILKCSSQSSNLILQLSTNS